MRIMRVEDAGSRYGAASIALHWLTAGIVLVLLFVGNSIGPVGASMLRLHTSVAVLALPLLALRIWWRIDQGHTDPLPRQKRLGFQLGKAAHYVLLAGMAIMMVSGPAMAWAGNISVHVFDWAKFTSTHEHHPALFAIFRTLHETGGIMLGYGTLLHVAAVFKHSIFDRDGTFEKIMTVDDPIDLDTPPFPPPPQ